LACVAESAGDAALVGILEMGGASTQIAFPPHGDILADHFPVLLGGRRYPLYVHSYLNYGMNAVHQRLDRLLVAAAAAAADTDADPSRPVDHPCMLRGRSRDTNLTEQLYSSATHTQPFNGPFVRDYPGEPVPER